MANVRIQNMTSGNPPVDTDSLVIDRAAGTRKITYKQLHDAIYASFANAFALLSRTITAGTGLAGGGSLAANMTISADITASAAQPIGTAAAGASGKLSDGAHVHALPAPTAPIVSTAGVLSISDASDTAKGAVELATSAESYTGTDTVRAVTPKALADTLQPGTSVQAGAYALAVTDISNIVYATHATANAFTLPSFTANLVTGRSMMLTIEPEAAACVVTITPAAGVSINRAAATTPYVGAAGVRICMISRDGLNWRVGGA